MSLMLLFGIQADCGVFFFFKQKTAYEMRISDWSSDVCSSDLTPFAGGAARLAALRHRTRDPRRARNSGARARRAAAASSDDDRRAVLSCQRLLQSRPHRGASVDRRNRTIHQAVPGQRRLSRQITGRPDLMPLRTLIDPHHLPALNPAYALRRPALGLGPNDPPPRILLDRKSTRLNSSH